MSELSEPFAHGGEHLVNDEEQAQLTIALLAIFAFLSMALLILAIKAA